MSDVQATPAAIAVPATETVPTPAAETAPVIAATEAPAAAAADEPVVAPVETAPAAVTAAEAAPAAVAAEEAKPVEPVNEGLLGYKAPGLLKQFTFAKKDFWFSDEAVAPEHLSSYLRGEKAEISHPVVAYASQTGKGLLFFVKKGENDKSKPAGVLPLYEATDLKKTSQHEFTFRLHNQSHSFKASSDVERDGWYQSVEKSIELGKAQKETVVESEGYKAELQKLASPISPAGGAAATVAAAAAGTGAAAVVAGKKSTDIDRAEGVKPTSDDDEEVKKTKKSRSTSRGLVARLRGKKEELEAKIEQNIQEHEAAVEEKKEQKEAEKAERAAEAAAVESETTEAAVDEKPKPTKRGSIFGSLKAALATPTKEKEAKEAELKPEGAVSDVAPQLPETAAAPAIVEPVAPAATEPVVAEPAVAAEPAVPAEETVVTPSREKKNFLSGIGFLNKRDRSVSPSAPLKETAAVTAPVVAADPSVAATEPFVETPAATEAVETKEEEEATPATKRQSVFGGLGRRASKMISRIGSSKDVTPAAETKAEESAVTETAAPAAVESDLAAHEATEPVAAAETTAETTEAVNKPEVIATPFGTTVTASA